MASSMEWCKLFPKSGEPSRVYRFPIKDNNHMIQLDSPKFEEQYRIICEFFSNCELTQALIASTIDCPLTFGAHQSNCLREVIPLLTTEELQIPRFEKRPSSETLLQFIRLLGYNTEITRLSNFRRQPLPPIWNFMFSVLNRTITCKLGSMDQATPEIMSIMYALFFNRIIDMAGIIFDLILTFIENKNKCLAKESEQMTPSSKCTRRAVNDGAREDPSDAGEVSSSTSSEASEDESLETSSEDSQREKSESPKDLEKLESSHPSPQKDSQSHIYFRTPTPSRSATTQSNQPDPEATVIETEAQRLTCLDRKLNSHIHFQSFESEEDLVDNRTHKDASPKRRGPSESPSKYNMQSSLKEGSSGLEDKLATCVVTNVPISDLLTKSEFQRFCKEVRGSMNEHNFQRIDGSETSALRSENNKLRAEVSTLKTQLLDSTNRIQGLGQELFQHKAVSSLEIATLKAQIATLQTQSSSFADVQRELKDIRDKVVATRSLSLSSEQLASISNLIKSTIQASLPSTSAPSEIPISPVRTTEDLITKNDLASFKSAIISRMLTCSSKISVIAQNRSAPPTSTNRGVQEKKLERNTTFADDNQAIQTSPVPVTLLAPSTSGAPIVPIVNAEPETIGALEEDEDEQLIYFSTSNDAFSSPERPNIVMRDAFGSESEKEEKSDSEEEEEEEEGGGAAEEEQVEVIDVEEYIFKNSQPHHTSTEAQLRESPEIDGYISEPTPENPQSQAKEPETTQLSAEETTMVVDEQAPQEDLIQKVSIGLPTKVFTHPPTFLAFKPEASIEDHFRYIYCEFNLEDTLVIPLNSRIRENMPDYERRFIRDKTTLRAKFLSDDPIIKVNKITERKFAYNKIIYRHYEVIRSDQKVYKFNDNDLVNLNPYDLNPYDLTHLYAYCSARYDQGREFRMGMFEVRRAMEAYVKLRAKLDFQISLNLGEEKLGVTEPVEMIENLDKQKTGSIIAEPLGFVYRVNQIKKIFFAS
ncbi:hypothetical protein L6452_22035 [Arctium lappa]|uniref:Uncharacterized protein n=1 Tax=Arctium lappa TaxID=4217 RepID=A0ACB9AYA1_ARCLA|nr:hypothetical protein L6452_22035 [Arctium lappa]